MEYNFEILRSVKIAHVKVMRSDPQTLNVAEDLLKKHLYIYNFKIMLCLSSSALKVKKQCEYKFTDFE